MSRKNLFVILLISFAIVFSSCGSSKSHGKAKKSNTSSNSKQQSIQSASINKNNSNSENVKAQSDSQNVSYQITKSNYTYNDVKINYPQITNLSDTNKQKNINDLIKNEALKIYYNNKDIENELSIDINYDIKWKSDNLLSIEYLGYYGADKAAHPNNIFYTTNIDISKGSGIKLRDIVKIDDNFVDKFKNGKYVPWDTGLNLESQGLLNNTLKNISNEELIKYFNGDETYFYFTKDSLGISTEVSHALGDHLEIEIKYTNLLNNKKSENQVWKDFNF